METDRPDLWPEAVPMWLKPAQPEPPQPPPPPQPADDAEAKP